MKKLTEEEKEIVNDLYTKGETCINIARELNKYTTDVLNKRSSSSIRTYIAKNFNDK